MAKYELTKNTEAVKLNKRTGIPLTEPPTTIPFGAILDNVEESGDVIKFNYLTDRFQFRKDNVSGALHPIGDSPSLDASPAAATNAPATPAGPQKPLLDFESLRVKNAPALTRAKVPGGWLVSSPSAVTFYPDPSHSWDGGSL